MNPKRQTGEEKPKAKLARASQAILDEETDKEEEQQQGDIDMDISDAEYESE